MEPDSLQVLLVLGPIAMSAVLGPLLIQLINKAKSRAEAENFETQSDKIRFEAMDVLVGHMRKELEFSKVELAGERAVSKECRAQRDVLEAQLGTCERGAAESLRWAIALYEQVTHHGSTPTRPPTRVVAMVDELDADSARVLPRRARAILNEIAQEARPELPPGTTKAGP